MSESVDQTLRDIYDRLWTAYGPQRWWPADSAIEVVVGAILAQNTAWSNVERAISNLKSAGCLSWTSLREIPQEELEQLIQPSGTFRVKGARLKAFVQVLWGDHDGSLESLLKAGTRWESRPSVSGESRPSVSGESRPSVSGESRPSVSGESRPSVSGESRPSVSLLKGPGDGARRRLLAICGIGPETADAILLYAGQQPTFVIDAYTLRILRRHRIIDAGADYDSVQQSFHGALPREHQLYNEYHALLVAVGKKHCRVRARCDGCPLADLPHDAEL